MSIVRDGADTAATVAAQVDAGTGLDGARNLFRQQAVHPPFMMPTQVQVMKVRVRHQKQEEGEKRR
jgi:hypothetical protein